MKSQNGRRWAQSAGCCDAAFPQQTVMSRTNIRRATPQHRPAGPARPPSWLDTVSHLHLHQIYDATEKTVSSFIENFVLATLLSCAAYFFNAESLHTLISAIMHPPHRPGKQCKFKHLLHKSKKSGGFPVVPDCTTLGYIHNLQLQMSSGLEEAWHPLEEARAQPADVTLE